MKTLQHLVDWLLELDPEARICWPCILVNVEVALHYNHDEYVCTVIRRIQAQSNQGEAVKETFLRIFNQTILGDMAVPIERLHQLPCFKVEDGMLGFSWKAFTHWIIAGLEHTLGVNANLQSSLRERVESYKRIFR